ncbi:helix-turn-helix domain-containing protein [Wenyingzhuangia sp. IMCC45574]
MTPEYNQIYTAILKALKRINIDMCTILEQSERYKKETELKLLTKADVKELFGISYGTISNWSDQGILLPISLEGKVYFDMKDIKATIKKAKEQGNPKKKE